MSDRNTINSSGFPLQMALRRLVDSQFRAKEDWNTLYEEQAWRHPETKEEGFIDLAFQKRFNLVLVVECKRVRDAMWYFLSRKNVEDEKPNRATITGWQSTENDGAWHGTPSDPRSYLAMYCTVTGQSSNDLKRKPLLETIAANLVYSTEALAFKERPAYRKAIAENIIADRGRWYFPIIVTTATLKVARIDAAEIDLATGELPENSATKYEEVPWVRFKKQLHFRESSQSYTSAAGFQFPDESITLFVVNANNFFTFLSKFEQSNREYP